MNKFMKINQSMLLFIVMSTFITVNFSYAAEHSIQNKYKEIYWAFPTLSILFVAILCYIPINNEDNKIFSKYGNYIAFSILLLLLSINFYQSYQTYYAKLAIFSIVISSLIIIILLGIEISTKYVIIVGFLWVACFFLQEDYRIIGGDLLPIVLEAGKVFLNGMDPYTHDYSNITGSTFFYMPLQWIIFLPAARFSFDPRIINISVLILFFLFLIVWNKKFNDKNFNEIKLITVCFAAILISPLFARAGQRTYILPYWFFLVLFILSFISEKDILSAILCGLIIAMRQTFIFDAAVFFVGMLSIINIKHFIGYCMISFIILSVILYPFIIRYPDFIYQMFVYRPSLAITGNFHNEIASGQVGLVPILRSFGLSFPIFLPQAILVLVGLIFAAIRKPSNRFEIAMAAGGMDLLASLSGSQTFEYYWGSGFIVIIAAFFFGGLKNRQPSILMHSIDSRWPSGVRIYQDGTDSMRDGKRAG